MRDIKFRAFDKGSSEMVYMKNRNSDFVFEFNDEWQMELWCPYHDDDWNYDTEKRDAEIMQFTWLLDKNGKEIWEWDVVLIFWITAEVKYSDIWCWWVFFCSQKPKELQELPFYDWTKWNYTECEIIGNVYENPEIL